MKTLSHGLPKFQYFVSLFWENSPCPYYVKDEIRNDLQ